jgi:hypothetical protein
MWNNRKSKGTAKITIIYKSLSSIVQGIDAINRLEAEAGDDLHSLRPET